MIHVEDHTANYTIRYIACDLENVTNAIQDRDTFIPRIVYTFHRDRGRITSLLDVQDNPKTIKITCESARPAHRKKHAVSPKPEIRPQQTSKRKSILRGEGETNELLSPGKRRQTW